MAVCRYTMTWLVLSNEKCCSFKSQDSRWFASAAPWRQGGLPPFMGLDRAVRDRALRCGNSEPQKWIPPSQPSTRLSPLVLSAVAREHPKNHRVGPFVLAPPVLAKMCLMPHPGPACKFGRGCVAPVHLRRDSMNTAAIERQSEDGFNLFRGKAFVAVVRVRHSPDFCGPSFPLGEPWQRLADGVWSCSMTRASAPVSPLRSVVGCARLFFAGNLRRPRVVQEIPCDLGAGVDMQQPEGVGLGMRSEDWTSSAVWKDSRIHRHQETDGLSCSLLYHFKNPRNL